MSNGKLTDCGIQSGAVLWLRHSFARAFSGDSLLVDCNASARNDTRLSLCIIFLSLRAFARMRGNQQAKKSRIIRDSKTFDCFALLAMTNCAYVLIITLAQSM